MGYLHNHSGFFITFFLTLTGKSPSWNLSRVMVHDMNTDRKYLFINNNIIAVEEGDGSLERVIAIAGPEEVKSFNHLFYSTTQRNITDKHIWFSIFIRPAKSRFTRVQRLSCCLTLLYFTMLSSMMFYEIGGAQSSADATYHLGPFAFAPAQIGIGVMTTLIIFPINILIVGKFFVIFSTLPPFGTPPLRPQRPCSLRSPADTRCQNNVATTLL